MCGILGPDAGNFTGADEASNIINVTVGFIGIDTVLDPDNLFQIQVFLQHHFDLIFVQIRNITAGIGVQQAHFGSNQGAFAVNMNGAAFQNEVQTSMTAGSVSPV